MSFLTGKTKRLSGVPSNLQDFSKQTGGYLSSRGPELALSGFGRGDDLSTFSKLFQDHLTPILAQAKESAGNLTGSGLGNIMGMTAGRETSNFLLQLLRQRAQNALQLGTSGVQGDQYVHQPGFLDYAMQGIGMAAPFLAGPPGLAMAAASRARSSPPTGQWNDAAGSNIGSDMA